MRRARITGCGYYLPTEERTNDDLAQVVETSDAWIQQRTGICSRRFADAAMTTADLAYWAGEAALADSGRPVGELDTIICATTTPDETFPATATKVQARLGMHHGFAFDVQAVCSGFIYALSVADLYIRAGEADRILVIGAEIMSRLLDWSDRSTCVLFGDGAGAVMLEAEEGDGTSQDTGVLATCLRSDGAYHDILYADGGPGSTATPGKIRMVGREVFKHAVAKGAEIIDAALQRAGLGAEAVDWLVPHQANLRIIESTAKKLGLSMERVVVTVDHHGNTSAASIPLALAEARNAGRLEPGDVLMLEAIGGGLAWTAAVVRW